MMHILADIAASLLLLGTGFAFGIRFEARRGCPQCEARDKDFKTLKEGVSNLKATSDKVAGAIKADSPASAEKKRKTP